MNGLILAAPASRSGKTTITLALLRLLARAGHPIRAAKSGPDYIDPPFHTRACGADCINLDAWAMSPSRLSSLASGDTSLIIEGAMGLFDGAPPLGKGAVADLARLFDLPVVLIVDASHMAQSITPLIAGFAQHDPRVRITGLILNKVGSPRHDILLRDALRPLNIPVLATLYRNEDLTIPSRHLGLVQAGEHHNLDAFLDRAADHLAHSLDVDHLLSLMAPLPKSVRPPITPPAQTIAIARDEAFAFSYAHMIQDWRNAGAEITFFSPLNNDPLPAADFVFLPGGYPELHAGKIASNHIFMTSLRRTSAIVYGECGGYMVLGDTLIDADGTAHKMAGLLGLDSSFQTRKLHLGYRDITPIRGPFPAPMKAHEFHYATTLRAEGDPLFTATDAAGQPLPDMGLCRGRVCGSFAHVIDRLL